VEGESHEAPVLVQNDSDEDMIYSSEQIEIVQSFEVLDGEQTLVCIKIADEIWNIRILKPNFIQLCEQLNKPDSKTGLSVFLTELRKRHNISKQR